MKFTLSWLKEHLETDASLQEICDALTITGLEVEEIEDPAEKFAAYVVGEVLEAAPHPDADKLQVLKVDSGSGIVQVVCGAPNARKGLKGAFAPVGTYVTGIDLTLKKAKIRGVESFGMMCSERELELSEEHDGIIDLDTDAAPGTPYAQVVGLDDPVIEIAITPNRPDALGVRGIARDLVAAGLGTLKKDTLAEIGGKGACPVKIKIDNPELCPAFAGRLITGVKNGPSPDWLQQRLKSIGLRPINALVDMTNYISFDRGRPLHVYDADRLQGSIKARAGKSGESFVALDGETYKVDEQMCVIADDKAVLGLGGIMGGEDTGCTQATTNVFIESAWFDPINTARTGRRLNLMSDARYRFERGVDPSSVEPGLHLATQMVLDLCGGEASKVEMAGEPPLRNLVIELDAAKQFKRLTGATLGDDEIGKILQGLGFGVESNGKGMTVSVPEWRPDVHGEADLVEEVVRIYGVDNIKPEPLKRLSGVAKPVLTIGQKRVQRSRRVLSGRGMVEAVTWSFLPESEAQLFGGGTAELRLDNPISTDMSHMRPGLMPGLITAAKRNRAHNMNDAALFEVGQSYGGTAPEDQYISAAGIRFGQNEMSGSGRHWSGNAAPVDLFEVKADCMALLCQLGVDVGRVQVVREAPDWYHPGRSGVIRLGPKITLAYFGELHPGMRTKMDLSGAAAGFELFIDNLPQPKRKAISHTRPAMTVSDLHPVKRDFAFLVAADVAAGDVVRAALSADKKLIEAVNLFDLYEGDKMAEGKKSLAIEVTLQPRNETLTDKQIEAVGAKVVAAVSKTTGGEIRG
ncbi:MAG: phenylalanine--tRNA ligase subunit beta [Hyphomicrobiaceae bacterium]|nr:phenylalanine--tRNA ligase subunit beta [Hyphomicrobiaceae bacterium]